MRIKSLRYFMGFILLVTVGLTLMRGLRFRHDEEEAEQRSHLSRPGPLAEVQPPPSEGSDPARPLIHFPLSVTSRNLKKPVKRFEELPLFRYALPTLAATAEPAHFRYAIAIAADQGDPWYDSVHLHAEMQAWWRDQWTRTWPQHHYNNIPELVFYVYANTRSRNTWAVNYATERGYENGADYFYRINDDSILYPNQWSSVFVAELAAMRPIPNLGVTGPADPFLKNEWLTHSFISRKHMEWYGTHFPFLLGNWWSDNWIQRVYGPPYNETIFGKNARLMSIVANVSVKHMVLKSRYEVKATQAQFEKQLAIDRKELEAFVNKTLALPLVLIQSKNKSKS